MPCVSFGEYRKFDVFMNRVLKPLSCICFIDIYHFRCTLNTNHGYIPKFKVAVAEVPWVSVLKLWLWPGFWARQIRQKRFELTIVARDVLRHFTKTQARKPGEDKGEVLLFSFQLQLSVFSYQLDRWDSDS